MDWVKSERDEALKSAEGAATRLKEAETAATRAKSMRRDELKKEKKDRNSLTQRFEVGLYLSTGGSHAICAASLLECQMVLTFRTFVYEGNLVSAKCDIICSYVSVACGCSDLLGSPL